MMMKSYYDLNTSYFKYFLVEGDAFVYGNDIKFLPNGISSKDKKEVKVEKIDFIVREMLKNQNITVQEYVSDGFGDVLVESRRFRLSKEGHSRNLKDFYDLCIEDENLPTICSIEKLGECGFEVCTKKNNDGLLVFGWLKDGKLNYTIISDDDLLSRTFSLMAQNNCVEVLYRDGRLERIFNSWGKSSIKVGGQGILLEIYMKTVFERIYVEYKDCCLVSIEDYDLVDFYVQTRQGKRLLDQWLRAPLVSEAEINRRLGIGEHFSGVELNLRRFVDLKKIISRIENKTINVLDMISLYGVIAVIPSLLEKIGTGNPLVNEEICDPLQKIYSCLRPVAQKIGEKIDLEKEHVDWNLTETLRELVGMKSKLEAEMERELGKIKKEFPGAKLAKGIFRVTKKEFDSSRKYTAITMCKTGITFRTKNLTSIYDEFMQNEVKLDQEIKLILDELRVSLLSSITQLEIYNFMIALIDIYKAFSNKCLSPDYCRPSFIVESNSSIKSSKNNSNDTENNSSITSTEFSVEGMWHPALKLDPIKNDINFNRKCCVLTGPNMGGKSTFIKSLSMVALYAQIGCYVPAKKAVLPIFQRIILRVGARDISSQHLSTFMVEMLDLNKICRNESFSLVLIDELGRGTSAVDGLSIIVAVKEFLKKTNNFSVITTHFSELNDEETLNKRMAVMDGILTYKVEDGISDSSFGINVARICQFPAEVIDDALKFIK